MFADFMVNTWVAATVVAVVAGMVGMFVVMRGASFAAHALPLGTFPGAAAANVLGLNPVACLLAFALLGVAGISQLGRSERHEVATALTLTVLLGLGALFLSMTTAYAQAVEALLFGQILGVTRGELLALLAASVAELGLLAVLFRPLLLDSVSTELAAVRRVSSRGMEVLFLLMLALATSVALPVVGALLVFSLMVGPASAARALTDRPIRAMVLSAVLAVVVVWVSVALAFLSDWPIGFFVGAFGAVAYAAGRVWLRGGLASG
ncbi:MAG: metal ABC transporter permease [Acetobacteraceae bacterium]|nr:metal ABC transporter permease [Acetobacteraceae bacterium]